MDIPMFEIELELEAPVIEKFTCDVFLRFSVSLLTRNHRDNDSKSSFNSEIEHSRALTFVSSANW